MVQPARRAARTNQGLPCEGTDNLRASLSSGTGHSAAASPQRCKPRIQRVQTKAVAFHFMDRMAFWKASRKVRPMLMASPTLFI